MYTNFRGRFKGKELKDMLWDAARASNDAALKTALEVIEEKNMEARQWLNDRPCENWSRACFGTTALCDILTNNLCECFNRYILDARDKAIISMLEIIRSQLMKRMFRKREELKRVEGNICPKIKKKVDKLLNVLWAFSPLIAGSPQIQVVGPDGQKVVDMQKQECSCRRWQLTGIPCAHALACIIAQNEDPLSYVNKCYSVETCRKVYEHVIPGINGPELWPNPNLDNVITPSSPIKVKRGRRQKARRKEAEEKERAAADKGKLPRTGLVKMKCSHCGIVGHNVRYHGKEVQDQYAEKSKRKRTPKPTDSTGPREASAPTAGPAPPRSTTTTSSTETGRGTRAKGIVFKEPIPDMPPSAPSYEGKGKGKMPSKRHKK